VTRIPEAREVDGALKNVRSALRNSLKQLNKVAGVAMAKGNYTAGEALAAKGREIQAFETEVEALRDRWRQLRAGNQRSGGEKKPTTPLWQYYQPILRALCQIGGEARRQDFEPIVEGLLDKTLVEGDRAPMARGQERWQVMIRRARRHLVQEGWIEDRKGAVWQITQAGRKAATARPPRG